MLISHHELYCSKEREKVNEMSQSVRSKIYGKLSNRVRERQGEIINMAFEAMKQYDLGLFRRCRLMVFIGSAIKSLKA